MIGRVVAPIFSLALSACSVFGIRSGVPEVPFTIVDRIDAIEIRSYSSRVVAEVQNVKDSSEAFYLLFGYISGANTGQRSIAMTSPVEVSKPSTKIAMTAPVEVSEDPAAGVSMKFFLPLDYSIESAPTPTNSRVQVRELPPQLFAALRYSGVSRPAIFDARVETMKAALAGTRWKPVGEPRFFGFDPPFTIPFLRRNEAMIEVVSNDS